MLLLGLLPRSRLGWRRDTWDTPNGRKISVALEEMSLRYVVHPVNIFAGEQFDPAFLKISPNNRIPAIVDSDGPAGDPITVFESGAILIYLVKKPASFGPTGISPHRCSVLEWLMWQIGGFGPMPHQLSHFLSVENETDRRHCQLSGPRAPFSGPARLERGSMRGEQGSSPTRAAA